MEARRKFDCRDAATGDIQRLMLNSSKLDEGIGMNPLTVLLKPERVSCFGVVNSKKRALELASEVITRGESGLGHNEVFTSLIERERLGSTGLGHGVAIPHGRLKNLDHAVCAFLKLKEGVDFDASDEQPVDMICGLLVPEQSTSEHLNILAGLAEMFSDVDFCQRIRAADTSAEIYRLLTTWRQRETGKTSPSAP